MQLSWSIHFIGKQEIKVLCVKCSEKGCTWKGTLGVLDPLASSLKFLVPRSANKIIRRKDLEKHLNEHYLKREYQCKYCGKKDMYINITSIHM